MNTSQGIESLTLGRMPAVWPVCSISYLSLRWLWRALSLYTCVAESLSSTFTLWSLAEPILFATFSLILYRFHPGGWKSRPYIPSISISFPVLIFSAVNSLADDIKTVMPRSKKTKRKNDRIPTSRLSSPLQVPDLAVHFNSTFKEMPSKALIKRAWYWRSADFRLTSS